MQEPVTKQLQIGDHPRCAGRDFHESHVHWQDFSDWEITAPTAQLDEVAIHNERFFKRRFGFQVPLEQRQEAIKLKNCLDLTDREITRLKKSGLLTLRKGMPACLYADRNVFALGLYFAGMATLIFLMAALVVHASDLAAMHKLIGMLLVGVIPAPLFWFSSMISFYPLRIMRQRGIKLGQKWVLSDLGHHPF